MTAAATETEAVAADIDDSIRRKRFRVPVIIDNRYRVCVIVELIRTLVHVRCEGIVMRFSGIVIELAPHCYINRRLVNISA